jgi:hypothetical protein
MLAGPPIQLQRILLQKRNNATPQLIYEMAADHNRGRPSFFANFFFASVLNPMEIFGIEPLVSSLEALSC